jgi:methanogenic corrinoid protein MtbC1
MPVSNRSTQQAGIDTSTQAIDTIERAIQAIREFDSVKLMSVLLEASSLLSRQMLVESVLDPLLNRIGDMWESGEFRVVHEHMSSAVIRSLLGNMLTQSRTATDAPLIICTTPAGTTHELGALMVAVIATTLGWEAKYLGPDIPSDEIAGAVRMDNADAVALSITYPVDSAGVVNEIRMLGRLLPEGVVVIAGGRASSGYRQVLDEIGAITATDHADLHAKLKEIRANPKK